jgi:hypothetical protein
MAIDRTVLSKEGEPRVRHATSEHVAIKQIDVLEPHVFRVSDMF